MNLASLLIAIPALALVLGVWLAVHLLARKRIGARPIGCQGPSYDPEGKAICCKTGAECDNPQPPKARPARRNPAPF